MKDIEYDRYAVLEYAKNWAFKRNQRYLDFENLGGDCTNFASQCIYAGCGVMNYKKDIGWYYNSAYDRAAAWTSVEHLHKFLVNNKGAGPYAIEVERKNVQEGDIVQLGDSSGRFFHSSVIVGISSDDIYVAAHTFDAYMRSLSSYGYFRLRFLHISGARAMW